MEVVYSVHYQFLADRFMSYRKHFPTPAALVRWLYETSHWAYRVLSIKESEKCAVCGAPASVYRNAVPLCRRCAR